MITPREIEWTAAFLEGEGCFHNGSSQLEVSAGQCQLWPLEKLQRLWGGAIHTLHSKNPNASQAYQWTRNGPGAASVCMTVYSLMSPKRQGQIRRVLLRWIPKPLRAGFSDVAKCGHKFDGTKNGGGGKLVRYCVSCSRANHRRLYHARGKVPCVGGCGGLASRHAKRCLPCAARANNNLWRTRRGQIA